MKRIFAILILLFAARVSAQTLPDYYENKNNITTSGITFAVRYGLLGGEDVKAVVALSNVKNVLSHEEMTFADGTELSDDEYDSIVIRTEEASVIRIICEVFGDVAISALRAYNGSPLKILFVVGPDGNTKEVAFTLTGTTFMLSIPPARFAALEKRLMGVKWNLNDFARSLNFVHTRCFINFKQIPLSSELINIEKNNDALESDLTPIE